MKKLSPSQVDAHQQADLADLAIAYLNVVKCCRGRPINEGFGCPHCGSANPTEHCEGVT